MDMSSEFRRAVRKILPKAAIAVDNWHVVARANQMATEVRRRRAHDLHGQGHGSCLEVPQTADLQPRNMSSAQRGRRQEIIGSDLQLGVVWGIKEHVRQLLKTDDIDGFHRAWAELENTAKATRMREAKSLFLTLKLRRKTAPVLPDQGHERPQRSGQPQRKNLKRAASLEG